MKKLLLATTILTATCLPVAAQTYMQQSGFVTPGHAPIIITSGVLGDGGTAAQGFFTGLGTTASGPSICANSGAITGPYNQVCIGATGTGGLLSFTSYNGASGTLAISGNISLPALAGAVQCLQVNISGVIVGTGSACGAGGGGGGTPGGLSTQLQFNNAGTFGGVSGVVSLDGASLTIASGDLNLAGSVTGTTQLNASASASGVLTLPAVTDTLTANAAAQTLTNKTLTSPVLGGTIFGNATFGGTFTFSGTNNFQTGSFQFNGNNQTFPISGNIVGAGDTQTLTNKSINGSEINSGVVLATYLPVASASALGVVQGDGSTITISGPGVMSCTIMTASQIGCGRPDNSTIQVSGAGVLTVIGAVSPTIAIGVTTVTSGTPGDMLIVGAGPVLQQVATTGSGNGVLATSPTLSGTIGGNLTFSGNITLSGTLTAASLATPGTIGGSLCASAGGAIYYNSGSNCFGAGVTALNSLTGSLSLTETYGLTITPSSPNIAFAVALSKFTNSLSGNVALNTSTYTDGPTVAQGNTGTWFASGTVTLFGGATLTNFDCKLWDGTTVIASGGLQTNTTGQGYSIALSGYLTAPAGNLRISCISGAATGTMSASGAGTNSSTVSAIRIQ